MTMKLLHVFMCIVIIAGTIGGGAGTTVSAAEPPAPRFVFQSDFENDSARGGFSAVYNGEDIISGGGEASFGYSAAVEAPYEGCGNIGEIHLKDTGTRDYIYTWQPNPTKLNVAGTGFDFTNQTTDVVLETWFRTTSAEGNKGLFLLMSRPNNKESGWLVYIDGNNLVIAGSSSGKKISADTWYHIYAVIRGGYLTVYIDGEQVGTAVPMHTKEISDVTEFRNFVKSWNTQDNYIADYSIKTLENIKLMKSSVSDEARKVSLNTDVVYLEFSNMLSPSGEAITVYKNGVPLSDSAYTASLDEANRKRIKIQFADELSSAAEYTAEYADVTDIFGSTCSGAISFYTENSGKREFYTGTNSSNQVISSGFENNHNEFTDIPGNAKKYLGNNQKEAHITYYNAEGIYDFEANVLDGYQYDAAQEAGSRKSAMYFSVSENGTDFTPIAVKWRLENDKIYHPNIVNPVAYKREVYESVRVPDGVKYLRVHMKRLDSNTNTDGLWANLLYRVVLNGGAPLENERNLEEWQGIPYGKDVLASIKNHFPELEHPRILADSSDFARLRGAIQNDGWHKTLYEKIKSEMDADIAANYLPPNEIDSNNIYDTGLDFARSERDRILKLGLLYQVSGEQKYATQAYKELERISGYSHWKYGHFLNTAELSNAFAIGYDWCYDGWTEAQRNTIASGVMRHGLRRGIEALRSGGSFAATTNNWLIVCMSGLLTAALSTAEADEEFSAEIAEWALYYLRKTMDYFEPNGGYEEGMGYWEFAVQYMVYAISSLELSAGTSYGLAESNGFSETGLYPLYMLAPSGKIVNFADAYWEPIYAPQCYWLARRYENPVFSHYQKRLYPNGLNKGKGGALDLLWYSDEHYSSPQDANLPLGNLFEGNENFSFFLESWEPNALYAAFMAGDNQSSHGDLDIGSFVLESGGVRWAEELGNDSYNADGYFDSLKELDGRWDYYRKRAEGQNTLVINPGYEPDQYIYAQTNISAFNTSDDGGYAIADLTPAYNQSFNKIGRYYQNDVQSVWRGIRMFDGRTQAAVQDEISLSAPGEVWWFMHTAANINLSNGNRTATLSQNGKYLRATLVSPSGAQFTVTEAEALPSSPNANPNRVSGIKKLTVKLENVEDAVIKVVFSPIENADAEVNTEEYAVVPLSHWAEENTAPEISAHFGADSIPMFEVYNSGARRELTLIAAVYDTDGSMAEVEVMAASAKTGGNTFKLPTLERTEGKRVSMYVWEGLDSITPLLVREN